MWLKIILLCLSFILIESRGPQKRFSKSRSEFDIDDISTFIPRTSIDPVSFRLPNTTIPLHYDISLLTDIHRAIFEFIGIVIIDIYAVETTSEIVMHYRQLNISNINLYLDDDVIEIGVNYTQIEDKEFLVIKPQQSLIENQKYRVKISYKGILRNDSYGFFRGSYFTKNGKKVWYATTQFQATDARHAFPCYDEPQIRTSFSIKIRHHENYTALSNMPVASISPGPIQGYVITSFEKIPSMQTYLVAFTVSDFYYAENENVVPLQRVYAKPESILKHEYELALEVSPHIMKNCEKYFNLNYTFPKMDQIALPIFDAGAMENWGLISYREPFLLFDPFVSTTRDNEIILATISHEFVHQWLGNKVVMEWWTYLWLNEGFATLYEYYMVHYTYPEERYDDSYVVDILQLVFQVDASPNIRPMSIYVEDPWLIDSLFDWIAYLKSSSVLHTFMHAFGTSTWQRGLQNYIRARYDNYANPRHLYENLQITVNESFPTDTPDVRKIMESWEWQPGFPLLTVNYNNDEITLIQERFFYDPTLTSENIWWIPINYITASNPNSEDTTFDFWMNSKKMVLRNEKPSKQWTDGDWLIFNIKQNYYYRVNYDQYLWNLIIEQLNTDKKGFEMINLRNRAQLIDDSYHLARGARIAYSILFGIMDYLKYEMDYIPWVPANDAINALNRWLSGSIIYQDFQKYIRSNTANVFNKVGVEIIPDEPRVDRFLRTIAINQGCRAQLYECLSQTNEKLINHVMNNESIETEYINAIYCNGMRSANGFLFIMMQNKLMHSSIQSERNNIITGMGCIQNTDLIFVYLNMAIIPDIQLITDEKLRILTAPASNGPDALNTMIDFTSEFYIQITKVHSNAISNVLTSISRNIASTELFTKYEALLAKLLFNRIIDLQQLVNYRNSANVNLNWQTVNLEPIVNFFLTWNSSVKID